jgi:hypothetical protein
MTSGRVLVVRGRNNLWGATRALQVPPDSRAQQKGHRGGARQDALQPKAANNDPGLI